MKNETVTEISAKKSSTPDQKATGLENTVHLVLQGKGGVGKSFVAALLAEYIKDKAKELAAFDTDQANTTFAHYKGLGVKHVPVMTSSHTINQKKFDHLTIDILETEKPCIVDNGANTFSPLMAYTVENDVFNMLKESGKRVYIHSIVGGGDFLADTTNGFKSIVQGLANVPVVLWLNEYFGSTTSSNGIHFTETTLLSKTAKDVVAGVVTLIERNKDTFGDDIRRMNSMRMTVSEAIASDKFNIMEKQRIKTVAHDVFGQLDNIKF